MSIYECGCPLCFVAVGPNIVPVSAQTERRGRVLSSAHSCPLFAILVGMKKIIISVVVLVVIIIVGSYYVKPPQDMSNDNINLQSDPKMYQLNSVMGEVKSGGSVVSGATVTVVATGENIPVEPNGFYIVVLDPAKLGNKPKDLIFKAPGYAEQRQSVLIPENKQVRLDVNLVPSK